MIADHRRLTKALVFAYEEIVTRFGEACNNARFAADSGILAWSNRGAWRSLTIARYFI
jgi:hypothetical protein